MTFFNRAASIRTKLGIVFTAAMLIVVGLGVLSLTQLHAVNQVTMELRDLWWPKVRALDAIKRAATNHRLLAMRRMQTNNFRHLAALARTLRGTDAELRGSRQAFLALPHEPEETAILEDFDAHWLVYVASFETAVRERDAGKIGSADITFETAALGAFDLAMEALDRLVALAERRSGQAEAHASRVRDRALISVIAAIVLAISLMSGAMVWVSRRISRPLRHVSTAMERLSAGDHTPIAMEGGARSDEIGVLVAAASGYRDSLIRSRDFAAQAEAERGRLDAAINTMPIGLSMFDADKRLIICNPCYHELYGLPPDLTRAGARFGDTAGHLDAVGFFCAGSLARFCETDRRHASSNDLFVTTARARDGRTLKITSAPMPVGGWVSTHEDITAEKKREAEINTARAEAVAANNAKSEFLANMSHEIRTPLSAAIGLTGIALRTELPPRARGFLVKAEHSMHHLHSIIDDILDFSKIEAGKLDIGCVAFSLDVVLDGLRSIMGFEAKKKKLEFHISVAEGVETHLYGDPERLLQVLTNLVGNAIKFTRAGSVHLAIRTLETREQGTCLDFEVRDTGIGLSAEDQTKLFQQFSQVDTSISRRFGGTGLGLVISQRLVGLMGGTIRVDSEVGRGSTFRFSLPFGLADPKDIELTSSDSTAEPVSVALKGRRILVAEDTPILQEVVRETLELHGLVVDIAVDGRDAFAKVTAGGAERYDAVLMDVQMPHMDGFEATRSIRATQPDLPIIGLTAHALADHRRACLEAGMNDHIPKPIDLAVLFAALEKWLKPCQHKTPSNPEAERRRLRSLPGFDLEDALNRFGGDTALIRKFLPRFSESLKETFDDICTAMATGNTDDAKRLAHNLKGMAANISATSVQEAAGVFEMALGDDEAGPLQEHKERMRRAIEEAAATIALIRLPAEQGDARGGSLSSDS